MSASGATPDGVRSKLGPLKQQYKLTSIDLVDEGGNKYHVHAAINPEEDTKPKALGEEVSLDVEYAGPTRKEEPGGSPARIGPERQLPPGPPTTIGPERQLPSGVIGPERQLPAGQPLPYDYNKMLRLPWRERWLAGEHQAAAEWGGQHTGYAAGRAVTTRGGEFPIEDDTTRKPDVTAPGGQGKTLLVEVKTYGTYVTKDGKSREGVGRTGRPHPW